MWESRESERKMSLEKKNIGNTTKFIKYRKGIEKDE